MTFLRVANFGCSFFSSFFFLFFFFFSRLFSSRVAKFPTSMGLVVSDDNLREFINLEVEHSDEK